MASLFLDPLDAIARFESSRNPNVGYGGTDLSNAPLDPNGFPIWGGKDNSHAAGYLQFEPGTWAIYAPRLGITDFSLRSQLAVGAACYASRGFADWQPYNTKLSAFIKASGGAAAFSLGATYLAMAGMDMPAPQSVTVAIPTPIVTDQAGKVVPSKTQLMGFAAALLMGGTIAGVVTCCSPAPVRQAPPQVAAGAFDWSGSTFRFDELLRAVPLGK
jgi:hypothetical protein